MLRKVEHQPEQTFLIKKISVVEWGEELHLEWCTRPELTQPHGRLTSIEDDLQWKTTFDGR